MSYLSLPRLKVPAASKTKDWAEQVLMYCGNTLSLYSNNHVRTSAEQKIINLDLYNGVVHPHDFIRVVNPLDLSTIDSSRTLEHYPIAAPIIDLLVGEEIERPYEPIVMITNNIAVEEKQERLRAYAEQKLAQIEDEFAGDEEQLQKEIVDFKRKLKYGYKDVVEKKASALLNHYWNELEMEELFIEGYRRMWNTGEEVYEVDIINNEPILRVVNTVKMRTYGGGNSSRIEDSDIIVIEDHFSVGYLIDRYGSMLKPDNVDRLLDFQGGLSNYDQAYGDVTHEFRRPSIVGEFMGTELSSNYVDSEGNIRHLRVRWKAYKQIKKVAYLDPITGTEEIKHRGDSYKLKEGEALLEKIWIYDWWIGTLIGADMVVDVHPIPIRYNRISSLVEGHCGLVGEVYNINERRVSPPMGRMKPFQYLYDVIMDNIIVAMSKNIGPILEMDMGKKPDKFDTKQWLHYLSKYNLKFVDSFKEIRKGPATGKLSGDVANGKDQLLQLDFGSYIQQLINLAGYLETAMANIIGITPQRKGAISNRETVGGVERSTSQSSHMTAWYSYKHSTIKTRVLNLFIEAAKTALKDNPKKLQIIVDGTTREILDVMEEDFANVDLGISVVNSTKAQSHKQILEQAAHAYMQNGGEFSFVFDVLFSESMADKRRLIEEHEEEARARQQEEAAAQNQAITDAAERAAKTEQDKLNLDRYKADLDAQIKLKMKSIDLQMSMESNLVNESKNLDDYKARILELQAEIDKNYQELNLKSRELDLKNKEIGVKEKAIKSKPVTTKS